MVRHQLKLVASAEAVLGLTDSDDIADAQREGLPVAALPMSSETLLIPNTVAIIREAPHADAAQRLSEFLQGASVGHRLVEAHALEGSDPQSVSTPTLKVNWDGLLRELETTTAKLNRLFLR